MKNTIKKFNEENIVAILFLIIIFIMLLSTLVNSKEQIKDSIIEIFNNKNKTKYERVVELTKESDNIFNENIAFKLNYIDIYGLVQNIFQKKYIEDGNDQSKNVIKTKDGMLTFIEQKEDMSKKAENIISFNKKLADINIPLIYVQAPYKVEKNEDLPIGITDYANENANSLLHELETNNVNVLDLREKLKDKDVKEKYYITDHHWKIKTAFEASNYITQKLNKEYGFNIDNFYSDINNYNCIKKEKCFLGSIGKRVGKFYGGLDDFEYILPNFETNLKVTKGDTILEGAFEDTIIVKELIESEDVQSNRYASYFGRDYAEIRIENMNNLLNKKILIIQDSYGLAVSAMLSLRTKELRVIDLRHFEENEIDYIEQYNPDAVIMIYNPSTFSLDEMFDFQ